MSLFSNSNTTAQLSTANQQLQQSSLGSPSTTAGSIMGGLTSTGVYPWQYSIPSPPADPPQRKVEIPILYEGHQDGVFIVGKDGKRHYVPVERIATAIGLEW